MSCLRRIILAALMVWSVGRAQAVKLQILYRPSLSMVWKALRHGASPGEWTAIINELAESPESLGHVALFLPGDALHPPQIIGWEPKTSHLPASHALRTDDRKKAYDWIMRNAIKGEFQDNGLWALAGIHSVHTKTMSLPLEVTETDLLNIRARVKQMNEGPQFHFQLFFERPGDVKPFHFNCVGAITHLLKVTSIPPDFFPQQTECLEDFIAEMSLNVAPWRRCDDLVARSRPSPH